MKAKTLIYFVVVSALISLTNLPQIAMAEFHSAGFSFQLIGGSLLILCLLSLGPVILFAGHSPAPMTAHRRKHFVDDELHIDAEQDTDKSLLLEDHKDHQEETTTYVELGGGMALYNGSLISSLDRD